MIIQEKGQTVDTVYAAVRRDSSNGKLIISWKTVTAHLETTKMLTQQDIDKFPQFYKPDVMPLAGYCRLTITAEMLPFMGTSPLDRR